MRGRLVAALSAAALLGALLALAPSRDAPTAGAAARAAAPTLHVAIPGPFAGCDPGSPATSAATDAVLSLVLPSAFTPGPTASPVGDTFVVAQAEVVALAPQTVVYTIAQGAHWPDGTAFSASDLVRTWHERRADHVVADLGYRQIASIRPNAAGTAATVVFGATYSDWESLFNLVVPAATSTAACALPSAALDPSIGPYELASASSSEVTLRANRAWAGARPAYGTVVVSTDPAAVPTASDGPRVAFLESPTVAELGALTSTGRYSSTLAHSSTIVSLDWAVRGPSALAPAVRAAVAHYVDRGAIVARQVAPVDYTTSPAASHLLGQGQPGYLGAPGVPVAEATVPSTPVSGSSGADAYGDGADVAQGTAALLAAGFTRTGTEWQTASMRPFTVCLAVPIGDPSLHKDAGAVISQLAAQGVGVDVRTEASVGAVVAAVRDGSCTAGIVTRSGDGFVTHEAASWLAPSEPVPLDLSWTGVDDPVVSANAAAATAMLNPIEAQPSWNAMDAHLWDLMVGLPLYSPSTYEGWTPTIAGVLPSVTVAGFVAQVPSLLPATQKP